VLFIKPGGEDPGAPIWSLGCAVPQPSQDARRANSETGHRLNAPVFFGIIKNGKAGGATKKILVLSIFTNKLFDLSFTNFERSFSHET